MSLRKILAIGTATMLTSTLLVLPVCAHGHHSHHRTQTDTGCPVCTVDGCEEVGRHFHDDCEYCGYDHENGYCDGTCQTDVPYSRHGGHHGCHR